MFHLEFSGAPLRTDKLLRLLDSLLDISSVRAPGLVLEL